MLTTVDDHDEAILPIHRAIGGRALPLQGIHLLHFDSHPDLLITPSLRGEEVLRPPALYARLAESRTCACVGLRPALCVYSAYIAPLRSNRRVDIAACRGGPRRPRHVGAPSLVASGGCERRAGLRGIG